MTDRPQTTLPDNADSQKDIVQDPTRPPFHRGQWSEAAVINVRVTDAVKHRMRTLTQPWLK
ncbi:MAG: hypothetical protein ACP5OR_04545 [Candidatus Dormibacteria bacterium]